MARFTDRLVVLLRGINLGARNKLPMPTLKAVLTDLGYADPVTYLQSGNALITTAADPADVENACSAAILGRTGLTVPTVVRSRARLLQVADTDPYGHLVTEPADLARYQVTFLSSAADPAPLEGLDPASYPREQFCVIGREIYTWTPAGVHTAKVNHALIERRCGGVATARNRRTVLALRDLLSEHG